MFIDTWDDSYGFAEERDEHWKKERRQPISAQFEGPVTSELEILSRLGQGGMGFVDLAEQKSLGRNVAVKYAKRTTDPARLIREAKIMARLEHPNIVPIHFLTESKNGEPLVVMKKIDGHLWSTGIAEDPSNILAHIKILLTVCDAIRFAHSRNIIHRDIKPGNVMIGDFGEVYVLDWGLYLDLAQDVKRTDAGITGTPAYFSPEQVRGNETEIDERTDVYLLGATLYEILTGTRRHAGNSVVAQCLAAHTAKAPIYPDSIIENYGALTEICSSAMSHCKEDRPQSVTEFLDRINAAVLHRSSVSLSKIADQRLLNPNRDGLIAAEFGYQEALKIWSENRNAIDGLRECMIIGFRGCCDNEDFEGAREFMGKLNPVPEELVVELELRIEQHRQNSLKFQYLEDFEQNENLVMGSNTRVFLTIAIGVLFFLFRFLTATDTSSSETAYQELMSSSLAYVLVFIYGVVFWKRIALNSAGRLVGIQVGGLLLAILSIRLSYFHLSVPLLHIYIGETLISFAVLFPIASTARSKPAMLAALGFPLVIALGTITEDPSLLLLSLSIVDLVFFGLLALGWRKSVKAQT